MSVMQIATRIFGSREGTELLRRTLFWHLLSLVLLLVMAFVFSRIATERPVVAPAPAIKMIPITTPIVIEAQLPPAPAEKR